MDRGILSEEVAINFGVQICEIISYLHKQKPIPILYLDLKPQNVMIKDGQIYLVDFGNSMFVNSKRKYMCGTKGYAAPEQYNFDDIDFSTDIYGVGALLYFMVTGCSGICGNEIHFDTNFSVSERFKQIIIKCMSPKDERNNDALWVARNLNEIIQEKIRKNNDKKVKKELMEKPLVISVVGSEKHIGVTHFSLALTCRLNEIGIKTVYEDRGGKVIRAIYEHSDKCILSGGVYQYENILMKYSYSQCVSVKENINCKVVDYGEIQTETGDIKDADFVILIAGGKIWEADNSMAAAHKVKQCERWLVLWNYMKGKTSECVPLFYDPFHRETDINEFIDNVINMIVKEEDAYKKENRKRIFRFFTRKK